jgi:hypothetical protein
VAGLNTVSDGDELDAMALEPAVELEGFHEVPREAGQVVDQNHRERRVGGERCGDEALVGRPMLDAEPGQGGVMVDVPLRDLPTNWAANRRQFRSWSSRDAARCISVLNRA